MDETQTFYLLKQHILDRYLEAYPYYSGSIQHFGNKEIAQLIDLVERDCRERVSEKWVYTHLKPTVNKKLPRRDMLDIFCRWAGYAGWEEFVFKNQNTKPGAIPAHKPGPLKGRRKMMGLALSITGAIICIGAALLARSHKVSICLKDRYTQKSVANDKVSVFAIENGKNKNCTIRTCVIF